MCYDMAGKVTGDFLSPIQAPTQKADMGSRARAPEDPKKAAQKEQPASQAGNANATNHCK